MIATENGKPVHWTQMRYRVKPTRFEGLRLWREDDDAWWILHTNSHGVTSIMSSRYTSEAEALAMVGQIRNNLIAGGRP